MKKYILGLGAMLVGAGLMFIFTHAEVSAEEDKLKKIDTDCRVWPAPRKLIHSLC